MVDIAKLRDYCLNSNHPEGRHKARVFLSALGLTAADAEVLKTAFLSAAMQNDAIATELDEFGQRYVVDLAVYRGERKAFVRTSWVVRKQEDFPRLTSCYVL